VLSRRVGDRILIGKDVWLTVVQIAGDKVRIGIEAPKDVPIIRQEILPDDNRDKPSN
jgi:carbon storage regulator